MILTKKKNASFYLLITLMQISLIAFQSIDNSVYN